MTEEDIDEAFIALGALKTHLQMSLQGIKFSRSYEEALLVVFDYIQRLMLEGAKAIRTQNLAFEINEKAGINHNEQF